MRVHVLSLVVSSALAFYHAQPPRRSLGRVWATSTRIEPREIAMPADPTDPFLLVRQDLKRMKRRIKELVEIASSFGSAGLVPVMCFGLFSKLGGAGAASVALIIGLLG